MVARTVSAIATTFLRETLAVISNSSVAVKSLSVIIVIGYVFSFWSASVKILSVTPEYFWPPHFWIWTAFTHCFLEIHIWQVIIDIAVIVLVGKLLEPLWGAIEMVVFFMIVNIGVAVIASFFYYLLYMITYNPTLLFDVHIHGLAGYLAGVSVAVKQIMPDHVLYRSPVGKITNRNVPLLILALSLILYAVYVVEGSFCTMFGSGLLVSWCYLRFYQIHTNGSKGDMADSFAFHTFFPNVIQPPIALICNSIFAVLVKIKVCRKPIRRYDVGAGTSSISISLPGVESHDTERRRQIALKALSERLNRVEGTTSATGTSAAGATEDAGENVWPSLEEEMRGKSPSVAVPIESVHSLQTSHKDEAGAEVQQEASQQQAVSVEEDQVLVDIGSSKPSSVITQ